MVRNRPESFYLVEPGAPLWNWLRTFIDIGRRRLTDLGYLTVERSERIWEEFTNFEAATGSRMITPGMLEIIARRGW